MAIDRLGNPIAKDNLFRIPVRPVLPLQIEPHPDAGTELLHVYPETSEVSFLTGRVLEILSDNFASVSVDGSPEVYELDTRWLEKTA
jgi:hypothetical protein